MFFRIGILIGWIAVATSAYGQDMDCSAFKTGRYYCTVPNGGEIFIKRTKRKQIERYNRENQRFIFSIEWVSSCTYMLTLVKTKQVSKSIKRHVLGTQLTCHITSYKEDEYEVEIVTTDSSIPLISTIYKNP